MTEECLIIGGGVFGASLAWRLAQEGHRVTLLEAADLAAGASGGPGHRGVRGMARSLEEMPLMARAYEIWPTLDDRLGAETGFVRCGALRLFEDELTGTTGGWQSAEARRAVQSGNGIPTELLSADQVREFEPSISERVIGALRCPLDGTADQGATTRAFASAAAALGAHVQSGVRVTRLESDGERISGVRTDRDEVIPVAGTVAVLANLGTPALLEGFVPTRLPLWPMCPQTVHVHPRERIEVGSLIGHDSRRVSIKPLPGGVVMLSGGWPGSGRSRDVAVADLPYPARRNFEEGVSVIPALEDPIRIDIDASRADTMCIDSLPVIDRIPGSRNGVFAAGWTGHGFAISVAVTELMGRWLTSGKRPDVLAPFTLARFGL